MSSEQQANDPPQGFRQIVAYLESQDPQEPLAGLDSTTSPPSYPDFAEIEVQDVAIDGKHGEVRGRIYRQSNSGEAGLVWVHGGAFIGGDLDMPEAHWVSLAIASHGFPVLSLDYRKALRGVRYPAPSDDVLSGWLWAVDHADEWVGAPGNTHLGGASAGANLVAGVSKRLRDGAGSIPASLVLVYPIVHGELPAPSKELEESLAQADPPIAFPAATVREMNLQFVGTEDLLEDPYAFAANGEVDGQPPTFILNSDTDLLRASGEAYAEALRVAGVDITVDKEPGTRHGHLNGPDEKGAAPSIERLTKWLRSHAVQDEDAEPR